MLKFNTGTKLRQNPKKNSKKLGKKSKNQLKITLFWCYINGGTFKIMQIRTPAVKHKKLTKKIFSRLYINGSTQERKFNFVKNFWRGIISGSTQEKIK